MKHYVYMYIILCFFNATYSMDDPTEKVFSRKNSPREIVIESHAGKTGIVPELDLSHTQGSDRNPNSEKRRISNLADLKSATSTKLTSRRNGGGGTTTRNTPNRSRGLDQLSTTGDSPPSLTSHILNTPLKTDDPQLPIKTPSLLPTAVRKTYSGKILLQEIEEKTYSEDDIWKKLASFNPVLHSFGLRHNMSIEELEDFALFLRENDVDPKVLTEYLHKSQPLQKNTFWKRALERLFGNTNKKSFNNYLEHFEKIKRQNPDNWEELVLELMKTTADQANGLNQKSQIDDIRTELLVRDNAEQAHQIRIQYLAIILQFVGGIVATVWAVYGGTNNTSCTNSTI